MCFQGSLDEAECVFPVVFESVILVLFAHGGCLCSLHKSVATKLIGRVEELTVNFYSLCNVCLEAYFHSLWTQKCVRYVVLNCVLLMVTMPYVCVLNMAIKCVVS